MNKMNYKTLRERIYYQLGYCAGYGEMGREILGYIHPDADLDISELPEYIEFEVGKNKEMLMELQKKLKIKTLDSSMAKDVLVVKEKE